MIKNRQTLMALAAEWTTRAKNDLREQILNFMREVGTDETELANALGISDGELNQILNGNGEITLSTFAKILIATENAIEIKPIEATPFGSYGQIPPMPSGQFVPRGGMRPRGGRPMPPMGGGVPPMGMPPMGEVPQRRFCGMPGMSRKMNRPTPPMGGRPMSDAPLNGAMPPMPDPEIMESIGELDAMPRATLVDTIAANNWENEINLMTATRADMINFLMEKGFRVPRAEETITAPFSQLVDHVQPTNGETTCANTETFETINESKDVDVDDTARLGAMLAEELQRNPHLKGIVERYLK